MLLSDVRLAIFFGGPSSERDISLDSARTFYDAIRFLVAPENIAIFFIEADLSFARVPDKWIYANTIDDYLLSRDRDVESGAGRLDLPALAAALRGTDAIFSFVHGTYGEDGGFERALRGAGCRQPMLGAGAQALETLYDKERTLAALARLGYPTARSLALDPTDPAQVAGARAFVAGQGRVVVKPTRGGSSDGVSMATTANLDEALYLAGGYSARVLVEEFIAGREFSVIVFQGADGTVMPLLPTEIVVGGQGGPIYTRVKKYMPGSGATHLNPAPFGDAVLGDLRAQATALFLGLGLEDWARFDGFLEPGGRIIWSDLNGVPGYGADSLLFQQAALFGHDQSSIGYHLLAKVLSKASHTLPPFERTEAGARRVAVIGGGATSERQVSRMSWLNVVQKLGYTRRNAVAPIYLDKAARYWRVPLFATLQHTVEEIDALVADPGHLDAAFAAAERIAQAFEPAFRAAMRPAAEGAIRETTLEEAAAADFVFLALHGGIGENGEMQRALDRLGTPYNGSGPDEAAIFMDKAATARLLDTKSVAGVRAPRNAVESLAEVRAAHADLLARFAALVRSGHSYEFIAQALPLQPLADALQACFDRWGAALGSPRGLVFKPVADGCSSGVFIWRAGEPDAVRYFASALSGLAEVPWAFFGPKYATMPPEITLKLPFEGGTDILVEELHQSTDGDRVIELTAAVYGPKGAMVSMIPSQTLTEHDLLTLEEKFCKGVGVNVTPPAAIDDAKVADLRGRIGALADAIGIRGYARIDLMYYLDRDELVLIEVNSLPGLSMATVTFTQALVTPEYRLPPSEFLEAVIDVAQSKR